MAEKYFMCLLTAVKPFFYSFYYNAPMLNGELKI